MKRYIASIINEEEQRILIGIESTDDFYKIIYANEEQEPLPESCDPYFTSVEEAIDYIVYEWSAGAWQQELFEDEIDAVRRETIT